MNWLLKPQERQWLHESIIIHLAWLYGWFDSVVFWQFDCCLSFRNFIIAYNSNILLVYLQVTCLKLMIKLFYFFHTSWKFKNPCNKYIIYNDMLSHVVLILTKLLLNIKEIINVSLWSSNLSIKLFMRCLKIVREIKDTPQK